jgi:FMN phosphatase YigB (HAD superfamily)
MVDATLYATHHAFPQRSATPLQQQWDALTATTPRALRFSTRPITARGVARSASVRYGSAHIAREAARDDDSEARERHA